MADMPLPEPARVAPVLGVIQNVYTAEQMRAYAAADNAALRAELANARAADIHSCHAGCTRAGCVNAGLRERVKVLEYELSEILEWAVKERAPLRDQEIASIRRTLEAAP